MSRSTAVRTVLSLGLAVVVVASVSSKAAQIYWCQNNPGCLCIEWATSPGFNVIEIRCNAGNTIQGWVTAPGQPPDGTSGSWQGTGRTTTPPSPLPGNPLSGEISAVITRAQGKAVQKLRGEKVDGVKGQWLPNRCSDLFANNPLGMTGGQVFGYITFRDGTNVKNENNQNVCATGAVSAWTKCCRHEPIVYICPSSFLALNNQNEEIMKLIHEALHVAGQFEDKNGSVGPGDPPNPAQIDDLVRKACGL